MASVTAGESDAHGVILDDLRPKLFSVIKAKSIKDLLKVLPFSYSSAEIPAFERCKFHAGGQISRLLASITVASRQGLVLEALFFEPLGIEHLRSVAGTMVTHEGNDALATVSMGHT